MLPEMRTMVTGLWRDHVMIGRPWAITTAVFYLHATVVGALPGKWYAMDFPIVLTTLMSLFSGVVEMTVSRINDIKIRLRKLQQLEREGFCEFKLVSRFGKDAYNWIHKVRSCKVSHKSSEFVRCSALKFFL